MAKASSDCPLCPGLFEELPQLLVLFKSEGAGGTGKKGTHVIQFGFMNFQLRSLLGWGLDRFFILRSALLG